MMGDKNLGKQFHSWLVDRMKYNEISLNRSTPSIEQITRICRGPAKGYLSYIIQHVYPVDNVNKVKGNLKLAGRFCPEQTADKRKNTTAVQLKELISRSVALRTSLEILRQDVEVAKEELVTADLKRNGCEHDKLKHKAVLLQCFESQVKQICVLLDGRSLDIQERVEELQKTACTKEIFYHKVHHSVLAETKCMRDVREACEKLKNLLFNLVTGLYSKEQEQFPTDQKAAFLMIESVMEDHSPQYIVNALCTVSQNMLDKLHEQFASLDVLAEAKQLREKYEAGDVTDPSHPFYQTKVELQTAESLLKGERVNIIHNFMLTQEAKVELHYALKQLSVAESKASAKLNQAFKDNAIGKHFASALLEEERRLVDYNARQDVLQRSLDDLHVLCEQHKKRTQRLFILHQQITDFSKIVECKQRVISTLLKQNSQAREKLHKLWIKMTGYADKMLKNEPHDVQSLNLKLKDMVLKEVQEFQKLKLPYLNLQRMANNNKVCVMNLSINRMPHPASTSTSNRCLGEIMPLLELPRYKGTGGLVKALVHLKGQLWLMQFKTKSRFVLSLTQQEAFVREFKDLLDLMPTLNRKLEEAIGPALSQSTSQATRALSGCISLQNLIQIWWNQPGQYCTPGMTVDKLPFNQWKDRWTVIITQYHQLTWPAN